MAGLVSQVELTWLVIVRGNGGRGAGMEKKKRGSDEIIFFLLILIFRVYLHCRSKFWMITNPTCVYGPIRQYWMAEKLTQRSQMIQHALKKNGENFSFYH